MSGIETILGTIFAAVVISLVTFLKKREKAVNPETFNWDKLFTRALFGVFVGVLAHISGAEVTADYYEIQLAAYGYITIFIQDLFTVIKRWLKNNYWIV